jgi:hypothetical protein
MPTYKFLNTETGDEFEDFLSISRKEELLSKNPHIQQVLTSFAITSMVGSLDSKTDDTWKEVLSKVAEAHPESQVGARYGKRSMKSVRTRQIVDQHYKKWKNN